MYSHRTHTLDRDKIDKTGYSLRSFWNLESDVVRGLDKSFHWYLLLLMTLRCPSFRATPKRHPENSSYINSSLSWYPEALIYTTSFTIRIAAIAKRCEPAKL
jgi:hypothetical protein